MRGVARFFTRRALSVVVVAATLAAVSGVPGAGIALAQNPSAGAMSAARELIALKGAAAMFDALIPGVIETAKGAFLRTNPALAKDLNEISAQLRNEYSGKKEEVLNVMARAFATRLTEQELKEAVNFYKTPLGKKLITEEAAATDEGMTQAQSWANTFSEEMIARIRVEMRKRGHNV